MVYFCLFQERLDWYQLTDIWNSKVGLEVHLVLLSNPILSLPKGPHLPLIYPIHPPLLTPSPIYTQENPSSFRHNRTENIKININYKIGSLTIDMLEDLVEEGDVQSACTMILVLGSRLDRALADCQEYDIVDETVPWFYAYLDLLSRFKLWNIQADIVQRSTDAIKLLNSTGEIRAMCGKQTCYRPLKRGNCDKCGPVTVCSVCRMTVRGVFLWCQGCGHGGHYDHLKEWFTTQRDCPAACGHECEWS